MKLFFILITLFSLSTFAQEQITGCSENTFCEDGYNSLDFDRLGNPRGFDYGNDSRKQVVLSFDTCGFIEDYEYYFFKPQSNKKYDISIFDKVGFDKIGMSRSPIPKEIINEKNYKLLSFSVDLDDTKYRIDCFSNNYTDFVIDYSYTSASIMISYNKFYISMVY